MGLRPSPPGAGSTLLYRAGFKLLPFRPTVLAALADAIENGAPLDWHGRGNGQAVELLNQYRYLLFLM